MLRKLIDTFFNEKNARDIDVYDAMSREAQDQDISKHNKKALSNATSVTTNTIFTTKADLNKYREKENSVALSFHKKL